MYKTVLNKSNKKKAIKYTVIAFVGIFMSNIIAYFFDINAFQTLRTNFVILFIWIILFIFFKKRKIDRLAAVFLYILAFILWLFLLLAVIAGSIDFIGFSLINLGLFLPLIMLIQVSRLNNISCTWCDSNKIVYIQGHQGDWFWKYQNKDGTQDKRRKNNYELAHYYSEWKCKACGAISIFKHYANKRPSKKTDVMCGYLKKDGKGERTAKDWER